MAPAASRLSAMLRALIVGAGICMTPADLVAQRITVGRTVTISTDAPADPHGESFLAINPKDPNNLLAATNVVRKSGAGTSAYVSHDAGRTWARVALPPTAMNVAEGWDVIVYYDGGGNAYWGSMYYGPSHKVNSGAGLWITRSVDGGRSWNAATLIPGAKLFDRPYMAFDVSGRFAGRVYAGGMAATVGFVSGRHPALLIAYSTDSTRNFGQPHIIMGTSDEQTSMVARMVVTPDGTLIAPFITTTVGAAAEPSAAPRGGPPTTREWALRLAVSEDGGNSIAISPKVLTRIAARRGLPATAIDLSNGPYRGRLYFLWEERAGDGVNIYVSHSPDNGKTWSEPVAVNDNKVPGDHVNPAIAVNSEGQVGVTWNDRRAHRNKCYDLYFSASLDGGATFLSNVTSGGPPSCPGSGDPFPDGGETQGLAGGAGGVFHAAWIDGSSGVKQLAATTFTVQGPGPGPAGR